MLTGGLVHSYIGTSSYCSTCSSKLLAIYISGLLISQHTLRSVLHELSNLYSKHYPHAVCCEGQFVLEQLELVLKIFL